MRCAFRDHEDRCRLLHVLPPLARSPDLFPPLARSPDLFPPLARGGWGGLSSPPTTSHCFPSNSQMYKCSLVRSPSAPHFLAKGVRIQRPSPLIPVKEFIQIKKSPIKLLSRRILQESPRSLHLAGVRPASENHSISLPHSLRRIARFVFQSCRQRSCRLGRYFRIQKSQRLRGSGASLSDRATLIAVRSVERFEKREM